MRTFDPELVEAKLVGERRLNQEFKGRQTRGFERLFEVRDGNFDRQNRWTFSVFVPVLWRKGTYVTVQPNRVPNRKAWVGLERRPIQFAPCTKVGHRGKCYAKLSLADVTATRNRVVLGSGDPLPHWMKSFPTCRKELVTATRAMDGHILVAVMDKDDWAGMIRLYLALKPWTLSAGFVPRG